MLHVRRASFIPRRSLRPAFTEIADWLGAADPGLARLMLALRGTLSVTLATTAAILVARAVGVTPVEFANGIVLSFMGPFLMREPTQRQRQRTLVVLLVPAAAATILTTLLHGYGPAGDSMFLALVFVCFLIQPHSPRMIGVGLVAVVQTYVGLYLELPPAALPLQLLSILAAAPIVALACFVVFPIRPAATLRRTVHAVQWRAARVLRSSLAPADPAVLRRDLSRLNEAALAADDLLALLDPAGRSEVRAGLIEVELATARMINAARAHKPGPRHAMRLRLHERRMRAGRRYTMDPASFEAGSLRASLLDLGHAAHRLGVASSLIRPTTQALPAPPAPPGPLAWRFAARVTLAAGIAMAAGMAISPQRWFWAVITVYVVFLNARSRGDTIYKGLQRLAGTLFGIASGLALALLVSGDPVIEAICLLLSVFGMFYLFLLSYTAGIFCVTVLLGLLYGMLGASLETVLVLRFEETAIGAMAAIFVAVLVLPVRTRDQVRQSGRRVLTAMAEVVAACRAGWAGEPSGSPLEAMRRVDRQVADLRMALAPFTAGRLFTRRNRVDRPLAALLECVHWARVLAVQSSGAPQNQGGAVLEDKDTLSSHALVIEQRLISAASLPDDPSSSGQHPALAMAGSIGVVGLGATLDWLDRSVGLLTGQLQIGVLHGFALDD